MPTYEFMCEACKQSFEVVLTAAQRGAASVQCPACGSATVTPRMSTFTAGRDELVDCVRMLRDAGYRQLAVQPVPGHEDTMADWMEVFSRV